MQMEELLTQYGDLFEIWLDGANGGDGWYGGAKEMRKIDSRTYYNLPRIRETISRLQPQAIIFSDGGPGCRWVGNEKGFAGATNWSFLHSDKVYPGYDRAKELTSGHPDGDAWVPAECDVSIRPGWFYHQKEDDKIKTVDQLVDIYYRSVGHNATMLLNFPVDRTGRIHSADSLRAVTFHQRIQQELGKNLLTNKKKATTDDNFETYSILQTGETLELKLPRSTRLNRILLQEYIPLGQRVKTFRVEYHNGKTWQTVDAGEETTTIGYKRILRFPTVQTHRLRLTILDSRAPVLLSEVAAYYAPETRKK